MAYRGPQPERIAAQFSGVAGYAGETATWVTYISASAQSSAYWAGGGEVTYQRRTLLTALFAAPQMGEARFREYQLPGGTQIAGESR